MQRVPMTPAGYEFVSGELERHKTVLRPQCIKDIEEARAHGDLSENAEYDAAKERQGQVEARIRELEDRVARAEVIDVTTLPVSDRVVFGCTITLFDEASDEELKYRIVGVDEADVKAGLLSVESPIARALLGRSAGDEARVQAPRGLRVFEIVDVEYI